MSVWVACLGSTAVYLFMDCITNWISIVFFLLWTFIVLNDFRYFFFCPFDSCKIEQRTRVGWFNQQGNLLPIRKNYVTNPNILLFSLFLRKNPNWRRPHNVYVVILRYNVLFHLLAIDIQRRKKKHRPQLN